MRASRHCRAISRRKVLAYAGASAASFAISRHVAREADSPFTPGVASGEPTPNGFALWTRLATNPLAGDGLGGMSGAVSVMWEVAADDGMCNVVCSGIAEADGRWAHSVQSTSR
jgi:alkaline phosphatase D